MMMSLQNEIGLALVVVVAATTGGLVMFLRAAFAQAVVRETADARTVRERREMLRNNW